MKSKIVMLLLEQPYVTEISLFTRQMHWHAYYSMKYDCFRVSKLVTLITCTKRYHLGYSEAYPCSNTHRRLTKCNICLPEESHWSSIGKLLIGLKAYILHHLHVHIQGKDQINYCCGPKTTPNKLPYILYIYVWHIGKFRFSGELVSFGN